MLLDAPKYGPGIWNLLTLCGTLVAALIGSIGGKLWDASRERRSKRDALIRYLSQLQTTIQMLESLLDNLTDHSGRGGDERRILPVHHPLRDRLPTRPGAHLAAGRGLRADQ